MPLLYNTFLQYDVSFYLDQMFNLQDDVLFYLEGKFNLQDDISFYLQVEFKLFCITRRHFGIFRGVPF